MFNTPLAQSTFTMIEEFCKTWTEGARVEYKRAIPSNIPKTVSSFANTMGGIWIIGVDTDKTTNLGAVPISGFPAIPGIEERITQACYQGIYPPITPSVRVFPVPSNPKNVVVVVKVPESVEAPHAIQNRTTVFVRVNSTTEPYAVAEIDRIEFLLNRRRQPEQHREEMIARTLKRSNLPANCLRIMVGPRYPYRPLMSEEALTED